MVSWICASAPSLSQSSWLRNRNRSHGFRSSIAHPKRPFPVRESGVGGGTQQSGSRKVGWRQNRRDQDERRKRASLVAQLDSAVNEVEQLRDQQVQQQYSDKLGVYVQEKAEQIDRLQSSLAAALTSEQTQLQAIQQRAPG